MLRDVQARFPPIVRLGALCTASRTDRVRWPIPMFFQDLPAFDKLRLATAEGVGIRRIPVRTITALFSDNPILDASRKTILQLGFCSLATVRLRPGGRTGSKRHGSLRCRQSDCPATGLSINRPLSAATSFPHPCHRIKEAQPKRTSCAAIACGKGTLPSTIDTGARRAACMPHRNSRPPSRGDNAYATLAPRIEISSQPLRDNAFDEPKPDNPGRIATAP